MERINWGMIGCGSVTEKKSGPAFSRIANSRLIMVMRRDGERAHDYAVRHQVPRWTTDARALIHDPDIHAVYIATPPDSHAMYAMMAAQAGKHVYVEKPMALNDRQCQQMIDAARQNGVHLFVAYYRRRLPYFLKIRDLLEQKTIGQPLTVTIQLHYPGFTHPIPDDQLPWRFKPEVSGGGLFVDLGSHQLDLLDFLFGPVLEADGAAYNRGGHYPAEDAVAATFHFANNVIASGSWDFSAPAGEHIDQIVIAGDKGRLIFSTFQFTPIQLETTEKKKTYQIPAPAHIQEPLIQSIVSQLLGLEDLCPSTGESAARTTRVIGQILKNYYGQRS